MKFAIGNSALKNTTFEVFKFIKRSEADALVKSISRSFADSKMKAGQLTLGQLAVNKKKNNLLFSLLNQKIALRVWKEYLLIRDKFAVREGGIVSENELEKLIEKQRLEEIKFYSKTQTSLTKKYIPLRREASQILESFHRLYRQLRDSRIY